MSTQTLSTPMKPLALELFPKALSDNLRDVLLVLGGSIFMALSSKIAFPLGFSPVPVSAQTLAIFLIAASLGSVRGTLAVGAYLLEGGMGLPVFTQGAGWAYLLGPTGGYLLGFLPAAFFMGRIAEKGMDRSFTSALTAFFTGHAIVFLFGASYLTTFVGIDKAISLGVIPFIPGLIVKSVIAGGLMPTLWKFARRFS